MPTAEQLSHPPVAVEGDGSSSVDNGDGSTTTYFPDGTVRVDYADKSSTITYPDETVLNLYPDGTRTLNDQSGEPLDPNTGQPIQSDGSIPTPPPTGADRALKLLDGEESIPNLNEAIEITEALGDTLEEDINPAAMAKLVIKMVLNVIKAIGSEESGCELRGWCYGVMYGALDMGTPPEPSFSGSDRGSEQGELDKNAWRDGITAAQQQLADGQAGIALRNKVLFRVARDGQPVTTLNAIWKAACGDTIEGERLHQAYENLSWPQPGPGGA